MSPFLSPSVIDSPTTSAMMRIDGYRQSGRIYESPSFITSSSHAYFWDVEELRHQEHLRRVSHAQYLYRHRHNSSEAARLYRTFMEEQNQWMDEQERIKEMESRLSARAFQQRASRWEEEWKKLEEGRNVEDILQGQRSGVFLLTAAPPQRGSRGILAGDYSSDDLSDLTVSPRSISSLDLPGPLLSLPCSPSQLVSSKDTMGQVDGTKQAKVCKEIKALGSFEAWESGTQNDEHTLGEVVAGLVRPQELEDISISQPRKLGARGFPIKLLHPSSEAAHGPRSTHVNQQAQLSSRVSRVQSPSLSLGSSDSNLSPRVPRSCEQEQNRHSPLTNGEVVRIISHKPLDKDSFLYLVLWRFHSPGMPLVECWVKAMDFIGGPKKAILEDYHLHKNLGAIRWSRDPRKQLRTSTSFGVREIKLALDERKQALIERGVEESEASREVNEERWKIREDWQRMGRGWGSAIMIVEDRKKAWKAADSARESQANFSSEIKNAPERSSGVDWSDHAGMMQAAGIINLGDDAQFTSEVDSLDLDPLEGAPLPQSEDLGRSLKPSLNIANPSYHGGPRGEVREQRNRFKGTIEDEREWREHFFLGSTTSSPSQLPIKRVRSSGLSRVESTLHKLPGALNIDPVRTASLPEAGQKAAHLQPLLWSKYQSAAQVLEPKPPAQTRPPISDPQGYLKTQRKTLLTRMLTRGPFKREYHRRYKADSSICPQSGEGIQEPLFFVETSTGPLISSRNLLGNCSGESTTSSVSSYISFDGASPEVKMQVGESWTKRVWDRFSYFLDSSNQASSLRGKNQETITQQNKFGKSPMSPEDAEALLQVSPRDSQTKAYREEPEQSNQLSPKKEAMPRDVPGEQKICPTGLALLGPPLLETTVARATPRALDALPLLYKSKPKVARKVGWEPSYVKGEDVASMVSATSRTDMEGVTHTSQLSSDIYSCVGGPSGYTGFSGNGWIRDDGKGKAKVGVDYSLISMQSAPLTRSLSQEEFLARREAEKQIQRDKAISRTKAKVKRRKEKADQYAKDLKKLDDLHSKKVCPLSKWKKSNQLELELLRMKLGIRIDKEAPKQGISENMTVADLKGLGESLLRATVATRTQPKECSPA